MVWTLVKKWGQSLGQPRAQRLTASMVWTPLPVPKSLSSDRGVLNALRHQWFGHQFHQLYRCCNPPVLNALRHQWFGHQWLIGGCSQWCMCAQRLTASMVWTRAEAQRLSLSG